MSLIPSSHPRYQVPSSSILEGGSQVQSKALGRGSSGLLLSDHRQVLVML